MKRFRSFGHHGRLDRDGGSPALGGQGCSVVGNGVSELTGVFNRLSTRYRRLCG